MRCQKARLVSWLNSDKVAATIPLSDGQYCILAVYNNGKYYEPEVLTIPDSPEGLWGPDGPINITMNPAVVDDDDDEEEEEDEDD